jgi:hypothetical protein
MGSGLIDDHPASGLEITKYDFKLGLPTEICEERLGRLGFAKGLVDTTFAQMGAIRACAVVIFAY